MSYVDINQRLFWNEPAASLELTDVEAKTAQTKVTIPAATTLEWQGRRYAGPATVTLPLSAASEEAR